MSLNREPQTVGGQGELKPVSRETGKKKSTKKGKKEGVLLVLFYNLKPHFLLLNDKYFH